jgi:hypothetical protein
MPAVVMQAHATAPEGCDRIIAHGVSRGMVADEREPWKGDTRAPTHYTAGAYR